MAASRLIPLKKDNRERVYKFLKSTTGIKLLKETNSGQINFKYKNKYFYILGSRHDNKIFICYHKTPKDWCSERAEYENFTQFKKEALEFISQDFEETNDSTKQKVFAYNGRIITASSKVEAIKKIVTATKYRDWLGIDEKLRHEMLNDIGDLIKDSNFFKKYGYKGTRLSGSSTTVYPIEVGSHDIEISLDKGYKKSLDGSISKLQKEINDILKKRDFGDFRIKAIGIKRDGSCPDIVSIDIFQKEQDAIDDMFRDIMEDFRYNLPYDDHTYDIMDRVKKQYRNGSLRKELNAIRNSGDKKWRSKCKKIIMDYWNKAVAKEGFGNRATAKTGDFKVGEKVTVSLETLYKETKKHKTSFGYNIDTSEKGYYDLKDKFGNTVCMDGETCEVKTISKLGDLILINRDGEKETTFTLSKKEADICIF